MFLNITLDFSANASRLAQVLSLGSQVSIVATLQVTEFVNILVVGDLFVEQPCRDHRKLCSMNLGEPFLPELLKH